MTNHEGLKLWFLGGIPQRPRVFTGNHYKVSKSSSPPDLGSISSPFELSSERLPPWVGHGACNKLWMKLQLSLTLEYQVFLFCLPSFCSPGKGYFLKGSPGYLVVLLSGRIQRHLLLWAQTTQVKWQPSAPTQGPSGPIGCVIRNIHGLFF